MDQQMARLAGIVLLLIASAPARADELADPTRIPSLPDITASLAGRPVDSVTVILGAPQSANVVGSFQFVQFRSLNCLSAQCTFVTTCYLTLTVDTSTSKIASAKLEGMVTGPDQRGREIFIPFTGKLCNADFSRRLAAAVAH